MTMHMGSSGRDEPEVMIEMNATPLIDVMMVLLIMLIITIPAQLHSVNLDMPLPSQSKPRADPVVVRVDVSASNVVSWNGKALADPAELEGRFKDAAAQQQQQGQHEAAKRGVRVR